jgi:hypothetical protein
LLVIALVAMEGSGDMKRSHADTFRGLSLSLSSSSIDVHNFFFACIADLTFEEAKADLICCVRVIDLVQFMPGAIFDGSMLAI